MEKMQNEPLRSADMAEKAVRRRTGGWPQPAGRGKQIAERGENDRFPEWDRKAVFSRNMVRGQHAGANRAEQLDGRDET